MKVIRILAVLLVLSLLCAVSALTESGDTAPATGTPTPDPDAIISDWRIENLSYITEAVSGRFTLKGSFSGTYSMKLLRNGSMSSDLAMDTMHDTGLLRFAIPELEFTKYTAYTWQDGILTLLPDGPQLACEYDPASDSFAVLYRGEVSVDDSKPAQAGQSGLPGGDCAVSVIFTLTHGRPGEQDGAT